MPKYKYTGTTEQRHTIAGEDVVLFNGNTVELPVGNERVAELVQAGTLVLVEPDKTETKKVVTPKPEK